MSRKGFELLDTLSLHKKVLNKVLGLFYKVSQSWPIYLEKKKFELHYKVFLFKIAFFKRIFARRRQFQFKNVIQPHLNFTLIVLVFVEFTKAFPYA